MIITVAGIRYQKQSDDIFFVHFDQNIFELNEITIKIIDLCRTPRSLEDLVTSLLGEYDVGKEALMVDLIDIVSQLREIGIIKEA